METGVERYRNQCKKLFYFRWAVTMTRVRALSLGVIERRYEQQQQKQFIGPKMDSVCSENGRRENISKSYAPSSKQGSETSCSQPPC